MIFGGGESGDRSALSHFVNVRLPFLQVDNILHLRVICIPSVTHLKKVELILKLLIIEFLIFGDLVPLVYLIGTDLAHISEILNSS